MSGLNTVGIAQDLVDRLQQAGVRATLDPRNVVPPIGLLVRPAYQPVGNACRNLVADWTLHLIGKGPDQPPAWQQLDDMLSATILVLGAGITAIDPDTYPLNDTTEAPSYRVTFQTVL